MGRWPMPQRTMTETTRFILVLAMAVGIGGWAVAKLVMGLRRWETRRLQRRLNTQFKKELTPVLSPVLVAQPGEQLKQLIAKIPQLLRLSDMLRIVWPRITLKRFLYIAGGTGVMGCLLAFYLIDSALAGLIGFLIAAYLPVIVLKYMNGRRTRLLNDQLVDALEFLSRALRAGHSFATGIQMMGDELPQPIAGEFRFCHEQNSLGLAIDKALTEMADRADSTDFAFFVTAVLIQRQTGGDLAEILDNIGEMIRNRIRLQQQVKALTAEGRLSGYILSAFPAVMLVAIFMVNPQYALTLFHTSLGQILLIIAFIMQLGGLFLIRRIVTINI
jgi:tight adherence protein B